MMSKSLYFNMVKEDFKRRLWLLALMFLVFFFTFPVSVSFMISDSDLTYPDNLGLVRDLSTWLGIENGFMVFLVVVMAVVIGVTSFSYLHSKQKVDFYHGIPVSRRTLFFVHYLDGILIPALCYLLHIVLALVIANLSKAGGTQMAGEAFGGFFFFLIHYILLYTITVISMLLTGNTIVGILGVGVLHFLAPIFLALLEVCYEEMLETSYGYSSSLLLNIFKRSSAFAAFATNYEIANNAERFSQIIPIVALTLVVSALLMLFALFLYSRRPSEVAGKAMAFPVAMPVIRIPIVITASLAGCLFFWLMQSGFGWALFGLVCGMALSHCVLEIIFHFDFKKLFGQKRSMLLCGVAAAAIFASFRFDFFGYDSYIPKESQVESVSVSLDLDYWIDYGRAVETNTGEFVWHGDQREEILLANARYPHNDALMELVKEGVKRSKEAHRMFPDEVERSGRGCYFSVEYRLKSGRRVRRTYRANLNQAAEEENIRAIYDSEEYRMASYPILSQKPEETVRVTVNDSFDSAVLTEDVAKLLDAYQKDLKSLKTDIMMNENPIGKIQFMTISQAGAEKAMKAIPESWRYSDVVGRGYYVIYPSFTNTIAMLEEQGVVLQGKPDPSDIVLVRVSLDELREIVDEEEAEAVYAYKKDYSDVITTEARDEIRAMLQAAQPADYERYNYFYRSEDQIAFTAVDSHDGTYGYYLRQAEIPEFLQEKILQYKEFD